MYHSGYKYTTHNLCQTECFVILAKCMSLYKEQLTKPIPATDETHVRVVTRYMGSGITASGSGSWTRDPGSQVMGSGSANFFLAWRGSRIDRFLDTLFFMRNKNIPFCKEKGLFSGLLKKLLTFILQFFYVSVMQSAV